MKIRPALENEAAALTELACRSKAHWPYDRHALEDYRAELEVFVEDIRAGSVFVGEVDARVVGFYALSSAPARERLHFLFVEPAMIGRGLGKSLWQHAIGEARRRGWRALSFYADHFAVDAFYRYQGCREVGALSSKLGPLIEMTFDL